MMSGGEGFRVGEFFSFLEIVAPDVTDRRNFHVGQRGERFEQVLAAAPNTNQADLDGIVSSKTTRRFDQ
jgi:hypothetical protein